MCVVNIKHSNVVKKLIRTKQPNISSQHKIRWTKYKLQDMFKTWHTKSAKHVQNI